MTDVSIVEGERNDLKVYNEGYKKGFDDGYEKGKEDANIENEKLKEEAIKNLSQKLPRFINLITKSLTNPEKE